MAQGKVVAICIAPVAGASMVPLEQVEAIAGAGLNGDRYCTGEGSYNKGKPGKSQVTLINARFFSGSGFSFPESRRNLLVEGVELMWLIGRDFRVGAAMMRGVKYRDPCERPNKLSSNMKSFKETFFDVGGIVAEVMEGGMVKVGDAVIPPPKGY